MLQVRKHIALFFLALIAYISLPKEFVHHCAESKFKHCTTATVQFKQECAVCDFTFFVAETATLFNPRIQSGNSFRIYKSNICASGVVHSTYTTNKAPPGISA